MPLDHYGLAYGHDGRIAGQRRDQSACLRPNRAGSDRQDGSAIMELRYVLRC
jgi:hypothetical protein